MPRDRCVFALFTALIALTLAACGPAPTPLSGSVTGSPTKPPTTLFPTPTPKPTPSPTPTKTAVKHAAHKAHATVAALQAGNPDGRASVPAAGRAASIAHPDHVIGHGSPAGCTSSAVIAAVAAGGIITFNCGADPITITLTRTAKLLNAHPDVVLDGGGKVTLSGGSTHRILYEDTCDQAQGWTTSQCQDQDHPTLTVQNLTFANGNSTGQTTDGGGGGAIFDRGGQLRVVHARFVRNTCDRTGPDLGGAAIRVLDQAGGRPVYVVSSTFGGAAGQGGSCSNGGALSSIGVSWVVLNSLLSHNSAVGQGANPARSGTPGGGSGGAIYTDGNTYTVTVSGTRIEDNQATEGGGALFFVSNDHTGSLTIRSSTLHSNPNAGFQTQGYPGIFYLGVGMHPTVMQSSLSS